MLYQSFETAGREFCVISNDTVGVIAPYKEGKNIITGLCSGAAFAEKIKFLRQAQRYTLNIYKNNLIKLADAGAVYKIKDLDIYVLDSSFYTDDTGASTEKSVNIADCLL